MYLIKHIKNGNYYKNRISNKLFHYVNEKEEGHKFKNKKQAEKFLENYIHKEHFEIVKS